MDLKFLQVQKGIDLETTMPCMAEEMVAEVGTDGNLNGGWRAEAMLNILHHIAQLDRGRGRAERWDTCSWGALLLVTDHFEQQCRNTEPRMGPCTLEKAVSMTFQMLGKMQFPFWHGPLALRV